MLTGILVLGAILVIAGVIVFTRRRQQEQRDATAPVYPVYVDPLVGRAPGAPPNASGVNAPVPEPAPVVAAPGPAQATAVYEETTVTAVSEGRATAAVAEPPAPARDAVLPLPEKPGEDLTAISLVEEPASAASVGSAVDPLAGLDLRALIDGLAIPTGEEVEEFEDVPAEAGPEETGEAPVPRPKRTRTRAPRPAAEALVSAAADEERPPVLDEAALKRAERRRKSLRDIASRFNEKGGEDAAQSEPVGPTGA